MTHCVVHNSGLGEWLSQHSVKLQASCKSLLKMNPEYGHYLGPQVLTPDVHSPLLQQKHPHLHHLLYKFHNIDKDYYCNNFELHIKTGTSPPTPLHNDAYTWLHSDKYQVLQIWVLLYDSADGELNLNLYDTPTNSVGNIGIYHSRSGTLLDLTESKDYVSYEPQMIVNGTQLKLGDILVFQNGIIHGTSPLCRSGSTVQSQEPNNVYRMALAVSYFKHTWRLTDTLLHKYYKFWIGDKHPISKLFLVDLTTHPYARKILGHHITDSSFECDAGGEDLETVKEQDNEWYQVLCGQVGRMDMSYNSCSDKSYMNNINNQVINKWEMLYNKQTQIWDRDYVSPLLKRIVDEGLVSVKDKSVISLGCGTGTNELYLVQQGATVLGIDISPTAVSKAMTRSVSYGLSDSERQRVTFKCGDVLNLDNTNEGYDIVFDRGCYHHLHYVDASKYLETLKSISHQDTKYIIISCNSSNRAPPGVTKQDILHDFHEYHIEYLENVKSVDELYGHDRDEWVLIMRQ